MNISLLLWVTVYVASGFLVLELWKAHAHLVCNPEDDPHSAFAYVVVVILGPLIFLIATLHKLAEYLMGLGDDR